MVFPVLHLKAQNDAFTNKQFFSTLTYSFESLNVGFRHAVNELMFFPKHFLSYCNVKEMRHLKTPKNQSSGSSPLLV